MQIETRITLKEWEQFGKVLYAGRAMFFAHAIALICLFFAYRYYTLANPKMMTYYIILPILIECLTLFSRYRQISNHKKFFIQNYADKELLLTYTFGDKVFTIDSQLTGESTNHEYEIMAEFIDTEDLLVIAAYGRQFFMIDRKEAEAKNLKSFLLEKNPNIKTGQSGLLGMLKRKKEQSQ